MKFYLLLFLFFVYHQAISQDIFQPDSIKLTIQATRIETSLKIDGKLDEPEWKTAPLANQFVQIEPRQREKANYDTDVRLLYNQNFLYIGVFCYDRDGKKALRVPDLKRDFDYNSSDQWGVSFDGFNDERNSMTFVVNPYGSQRDLLTFDDAIFDVDWDGLWRTRTSRTDEGWIAEIAIPWQTLRYQKQGSQTWGVNFFRNRRLTNELTAWSPVPRAFNPVRMNYAGKLVGITPPPVSSANIRVQPYLLFSRDSYRGTEVGYDTQNSFKPGGEIKWAVNTHTILDLTFNTDFAQADADRQVNNLTRFSVFFPERRSFFLENAGLFGVGLSPLDDFWGGYMNVRPFFSRKIGLDTDGNPVPIIAGSRLVYRSDARNAGIIAMRTQATDNSLGTNYFIGRFSENFGEQNRIGGIVTLKNDALHTNITASIDGFFRLKPTLSLTTMLMTSTSGKGQDEGVSAFYQLFQRSNRWIWWLNQALVTKNFNPEVGFVSRRDVIETTPGFYWLYRGKVLPKWIRAFEPGSFVVSYHQPATGRLVERQINLNPVWFTLQSGGGFGLFANHFYQQLDETFSPLGVDIATGSYSYWRYSMAAFSDRSKKVSYFLTYDLGDYFNGKLNSLLLRVNISPIPHINLALSLQEDHFKHVGIDESWQKTRLMSVQGRFALNPRIQLVAFFQKNITDILDAKRDIYVESLVLNNRNTVNVRFSWEFKPLSFLYLVYNQRDYNGDLTPARQYEEHTIAKISYLKQF